MSTKARIIGAIIVGVGIIVMAIMGLGIFPILITAAVFGLFNVIRPGNKKTRRTTPQIEEAGVDLISWKVILKIS